MASAPNQGHDYALWTIKIKGIAQSLLVFLLPFRLQVKVAQVRFVFTVRNKSFTMAAYSQLACLVCAPVV